MPLRPPPPLPQNLADVLLAAQSLVEWITEQLDDIPIRNRDRDLLPAMLYDLAIEHHVGIVHLVHGRMNGSAFALLRSAMEALVRGAWFQLCASDDEISLFIDRDRLPKRIEFEDLVEGIEKHSDFNDKVLSHLKHNSWRAMNSFTHGGMLQVSRRHDGESLSPTYSPEEVIEVLKAAGTFGLIALRQIARISGKNELVIKIDEKFNPAV
jgi:hypothetical protein